LLSPFEDILNMFGPLLGIDDIKKKEIMLAIEKLNGPEFKNIYISLQRATSALKDVMSGKLASLGISKKILMVESENIKKELDVLIKEGKISEKDIFAFKNSFNSDSSIKKLKSLLELLKK